MWTRRQANPAMLSVSASAHPDSELHHSTVCSRRAVRPAADALG